MALKAKLQENIRNAGHLISKEKGVKPQPAGILSVNDKNNEVTFLHGPGLAAHSAAQSPQAKILIEKDSNNFLVRPISDYSDFVFVSGLAGF